ncbi:MAG: S-methyl-5-thioribose-1-phosphate isomerase [Nitrospirae bacterium]|nr:MAG: S-methyl-5-thioribose-1-phosphate isomerase [Nitrospirota bacterium]
MVKAIEWVDGKVKILDQTKLPHEITYVVTEDYRDVAEAIKSLRIRGAPAIGIATAMGLAVAAQGMKAGSVAELIEKLKEVSETLLSTRPTAVNIRWAVERMMGFLNGLQDEPVERARELLVEEAKAVLEEDIEVNRAIGVYGASLIRDGDTILTHCNAGALATGGYGTATAPMLVAKEQGKRIRVIADETRPVLQGARLTAWELMQAGIDVTLITDNTAGALMKGGEIDLCIVGTDRTVRNGDVANKIGTYTVSVLAKEHGVPFYVAAPTSSIDLSIPSGDMIPIEERQADEVTHIRGMAVAPEGVKVRNIAFDVTPARNVTAIITEKGIFHPRDIRKLSEDGVNLDEIRMRV